MRPGDDDPGWAERRAAMVRDQLEARDIDDPSVLAAMRSVPRHCFVPSSERALAYTDRPLPIGCGQTISQPYVVAMMTQLVARGRLARVLDVGTGSGYQAAILAEIADEVYSIECVVDLAEKAIERLRLLGHDNVSVRCADARVGWLEHAPYDAIVVACAASRVPDELLAQLAPGGRLVIPIGSHEQELVLYEKLASGETRRQSLGGVAFVPMVGRSDDPH